MNNILNFLVIINIFGSLYLIFYAFNLKSTRKRWKKRLAELNTAIESSKQAHIHYKSGLYTVLDLLDVVKDLDLPSTEYRNNLERQAERIRQAIINVEITEMTLGTNLEETKA